MFARCKACLRPISLSWTDHAGHARPQDNAYGQDDPVELVTVIDTPASNHITRDWVKRALRSCARDDVFSQEFLQGIAFWGAVESQVTIDRDVQDYLVDFGTEWICFLAPENTRSRPEPGPYVCFDDALREVWLLVEDVYETFQVAVQPGSQRSVTLPRSEAHD